jgi:thioesterase domain-containing protein/acyl carrier protein
VRTDGAQPRLVAYYVPRGAADAMNHVTPRELRAYLRDRLPEYMVPSTMVPMESLPVGPTGKLDRSALPHPDAAADAGRSFLAPRTTIEHQFVQTWETLLGVHPIGLKDDFFELGGHSLLAVQMLSEMERLTGRRVPLAALFHGATIEQLATHVESSLHADAEPAFVVLKPEGREAPIVFLHGDVTGGGWYSRRLAPLLDIDAPMIVLPTLRESTPGAPASIEEMAQHHVAALRRLQPSGPYRLVGYCAGGTIAFEMARQLHAAGQQVEHLVLIDSVAANARFRWMEWIVAIVAHDRSKARRLEKRAKLLRTLGYYLSRLRAVRRFSNKERLLWFKRNVRARLPGTRDPVDRVLDQQSEDALSAADLDARPGQDVLRFQSRAARAYVPGRYDGPVDLVVAADLDAGEERLRRIRANARGWDRVARRVRVHPIASSHVGLITDQIVLLAQSIRECLSGPREVG